MKKTRKILSITMALLMLFSVLCFTVSASSLDGVLVEDVTLREENVKHFKSPDGSYTAIVYSSPVHRKDDFGNWQDIDNRMSSTAALSTKAYSTDDGRVTFSKRVTDDSDFIFELSEDGYSIKMSIANNGINTASADLSNHTAKYTPVLSDSLSTQFSRVKQIDNSTTVTYESLMRGVDLEYTLTANDIKENIVISREQNEYVYSFTYELEGLDAELLDNGSVVLADEITGKPVYRIPAPYMYDADGTRSEAVEYTLNELKDGLYGLTVSADASWINADEREFPVYIDPTITMNDENVYITYVNEDSPSSNYSGSGKISMTKTTMIKVYNLPTLPSNAAIYAASLGVNYSSGSSGTANIGLYRVYGFWTDYDVTWNDVFTSYGVPSLSSSTYATAAWNLSATSCTFDIKELVRHWYEGTEDYGIALKYLGDEDYEMNVHLATTALSISYNLIELPIANGTYYVRNVEEDKYLQKDDDAGISDINYELWAPDGSTGQRWNFKYIYNGCYIITSLSDNYVLDNYTRTNVTNELLHMPYVENRNSQQWYLSVTSDGYFKISPKNSLSQYLVAEDAGTNDAATVGFNTAQTDNSDKWAIVSMMFPLSGYELPYEPDWWNARNIVANTNCYAYALNNALSGAIHVHYPNNEIAEYALHPGLASYHLTGEFADFSYYEENDKATNFADFVELVVADANVWGITFSPIGKYETPSINCYKVALVINIVDASHMDGYDDYHWLRQNSDGTWSHKSGNFEIRNYDDTGKIIYDPEQCYLPNYSEFVGFFEVSPLNHSVEPFDIFVQ